MRGGRCFVRPAEMAGAKIKHSELRQAVRDLQNRGLLHSARWAAEQLYGLEDETPEDTNNAPPAGSTPCATPPPRRAADDDDDMELETPILSAGRGIETRGEDETTGVWLGRGCTPDRAGDDYVLAKAYFDLGEHRRASHQLSENKSSLGRFLRYYALFLAGEKRKNEEMLESGNGGPGNGASGGGPSSAKNKNAASPGNNANAVNPELDAIGSYFTSQIQAHCFTECPE